MATLLSDDAPAEPAPRGALGISTENSHYGERVVATASQPKTLKPGHIWDALVGDQIDPLEESPRSRVAVDIHRVRAKLATETDPTMRAALVQGELVLRQTYETLRKGLVP